MPNCNKILELYDALNAIHQKHLMSDVPFNILQSDVKFTYKEIDLRYIKNKNYFVRVKKPTFDKSGCRDKKRDRSQEKQKHHKHRDQSRDRSQEKQKHHKKHRDQSRDRSQEKQKHHKKHRDQSRDRSQEKAKTPQKTTPKT